MEKQAIEIIRVEKSVAGPNLWIGNIIVRSWLGNVHNEEAEELAEFIKEELNEIIKLENSNIRTIF